MAVREMLVQRKSRPSLALLLGRLAPETPLYVIGVLVAILVVGLVLTVVWTTFLEGLPGLEYRFSLTNYATVFLDPFTLRVVVNTLLLGAGTVIVNLLFAVPLAWLIHRSNIPFKSLFLGMMYLGIVIPGFLRAIAWILLLSPKIGLINQILRSIIPVDDGPISIYTLPGMAFLQGLSLTSVMFFMVSASFIAVDPSLEESAEVSGARKLRVLRRVTAPLIMPALVAAVIYNFMTAVSMFEVPALLGAPNRIHVLSTVMYSAVRTEVGLPNYGVAGVYGLLLLAPMLVALYFYQKLLKRGYRYAVVTGKGYRPKIADLGPWKWLGVAFILLYFSLELFLPAIVLIWTSLLPFIQMPGPAAFASLNLEGYRLALGSISGKPLANTGILIISVMLMVLFVSTVISWIVLRTRFAGRYVLDTVAMLPHAVPPIAFAFAIAFVALSFRALPLYGTVQVIVLAQTVAYIGFGTRTINGALIQIHKELEEAVLTCGCSRIVAIKRVILPLLAPALFYAGLWVGLLSYREVTMALFLQTPQNTVFSTAIWSMWAGNKTSQVAALGTIMCVGTAVIVTVLLRTASQFFYGLRQH